MNAFFVAAEFSLVRVRKSQVEILVDEGRKGAKNTKLVADNVNAYLSACQLGITLASLALGWLGEPAVSELIGPLLAAFGLPEAAIHAIALVIGFVVITALHIVVGELIPKSLAISPPNDTPCSRLRRWCGSTASRTPSCGCSTASRTA